MKSRVFFLSCLLAQAATAEELAKGSMTEGVRASLGAYHVKVWRTLGEATCQYRDHFTFDGFRITAPHDVESRDFTWFANTEEGVTRLRTPNPSPQAL